MKRITTLFALAAGACLIFTQIGCSDAAATSATNAPGVEKPVATKNKKLSSPGYLETK